MQCASKKVDGRFGGLIKVSGRQFPGEGGTPGNSWWGCAAQFLKSLPDLTPKNVIVHARFQTRPLKSILVFRPGL